jgi:membrane protease YdiL (CAAX protease family)
MKIIYQLKNLLDVVLWLSMTVLAVSITAGIVGLTGNAENLDLKINGQSLENITESMIPILVLGMLGYFIFILALFELKKLISLFVEKRFFTLESVKSLRKIGVLLFVACILIYIPAYFYDLFANNKINIGSVTPESFFFLLIIALFFFILSHIFEEAKALSEENELTV